MSRHICGCYYTFNGYQRKYLPQVKLKSHTTISPVAFTTELTQTFRNPNNDPIESLRYTFPLYDGVAVNGYRISYHDKTIVGVVKQKEQARQTYQAAVDRGETAGLLESLPAGVFGVSLGNVPAKTDILVEITYAGELKHDASIDGLRYMLPTSIAPRYGSYPGDVLQSDAVATGGISITVDVDMGKSAIRRVQSPSHPIALSMGEMSTATKDGGHPPPFSPSQASATLTQGTTELSGDFVLQLLIDDISKPQAILEVHPELAAQRAIMAAMVPKFALESAHPEIVFIADQSGSMSGSKNEALVKALKVFLKSLPMGVRFNICAFGSRHEFLWPKSQAYSEANVNKALAFVDGLRASYGGTEIFQPMFDTFKRRLKDMPLEVMLLTDGEIWGEQQVFDLINENIREKDVDARVFALGIGQDVSHTLVEGVARAGNGFAQFVTQNEDTDQKVVRMLKGALYGHTKNYQLEVHYTDEEKMENDDDFEIIEKVNDCLVIKDQAPQKDEPPKVQSLFDTSVDLDKPTDDNKDRYAHLPTIDTPKALQAPAEIPPMFPFNRTTVYLLLGPDSTQKDVKSITLRASSAQGPLELNIPIQGVHSGTSIHQLAARKAIQDLEEGRGWLQSATTVPKANEEKVAIRKKYESRFDEIVEREGVRLGERFQVASKWTSFVAVEDHGHEEAEVEQAKETNLPPEARSLRRASHNLSVRRHRDRMRDVADAHHSRPPPPAMARMSRSGGASSDQFQQRMAQQQMMQQQQQMRQQQQQGAQQTTFGAAPPGGLFGGAAAYSAPAPAPMNPGQSSLFGVNHQRLARSAVPPPPPAQSASPFSASYIPGGASFGPTTGGFGATAAAEAEEEDEDMGYGLFDDGPDDLCESISAPVQAAALAPSPNVSQAGMEKYQREMQSAACMPLPDEDDEDMGLAFQSTASTQSKKKTRAQPTRKAPVPAKTPAEVMHALIGMQNFSGSWTWKEDVFELLGVQGQNIDESEFGGVADVAITALVVAYFENRLKDKKDVWDMVVAKARAWTKTQLQGDAGQVDAFVSQAAKYVGVDGF